MLLTDTDIRKMERVCRLNLINSITGIKPANLVGTKSASGQTNLAIFSSVVHLGSAPPLLGMIVRPTTDVPRHTYENICQTGFYTINHVHTAFVREAHHTSAKFDRSVSEFGACGFTEEYLNGFPAPFVAESQLKIGMQFREQLKIEANGTILLIGEVVQLQVPDEHLDKEGHLNLESLGTAGVSGLDSYYALQKTVQLPHVHPPDVNKVSPDGTTKP